MNWMIGAGFAAVGAISIYFLVDQQPADVYEMPVERAYSLLTNVEHGPLSEGEKAAGIEHLASGNGRDSVTWTTRGSHAMQACELFLSAFEGDPERTHVTVDCQGGSMSDGAAAGMVHNMHRNNVIERVDATLTGRAFDPTRVASTSHRWPDDGVDGSLGKAMGEALEMERDTHKMIREMEEQAAAAEFNSDYGSGDYAADTPSEF